MNSGTLEKLLDSGFRQLGIDLHSKSIEDLRKYYRLLTEGNQIASLTSITGETDVAQRHFLDCGAVLNYASFSGARVIDVGTGAGFPGLVLRILDPSIRLYLLDSNNKKITFLKQTCEALGFEDVKIIYDRAEVSAKEPGCREEFDIVLSRALARLNMLCELCLPFAAVGGVFLAMKGSDCADETDEAAGAINILGGGEPQVYAYTLPGTEIRRSVVAIKKQAPTPANYPRAYARIQKKPL